jgi:hypothetical protein
LIFGFSVVVLGDEFGMTAGIQTEYEGSFKVYSDGDEEKLESTGIPFSIYFVLDVTRISFLDYQQVAAAGSTSGCCLAWAKFKTQVISVAYQGAIYKTADREIYGNFGAGIFQSQYKYNYSYGSSTYDDYSIHYIGKTTKQFDFVPIAGIGSKWEVGKGFIGLDLTWIFSKKVKYEFQSYSKKDETEEVDLGGKIVSVIAGVKF